MTTQYNTTIQIRNGMTLKEYKKQGKSCRQFIHGQTKGGIDPNLDELVMARNWLQGFLLRGMYWENKRTIVEQRINSDLIVNGIFDKIASDKTCSMIDRLLIKRKLIDQKMVKVEREGRLMNLLVNWIKEDWNEMGKGEGK